MLDLNKYEQQQLTLSRVWNLIFYYSSKQVVEVLNSKLMIKNN